MGAGIPMRTGPMLRSHPPRPAAAKLKPAELKPRPVNTILRHVFLSPCHVRWSPQCFRKWQRRLKASISGQCPLFIDACQPIGCIGVKKSPWMPASSGESALCTAPWPAAGPSPNATGAAAAPRPGAAGQTCGEGRWAGCRGRGPHAACPRSTSDRTPG